jgi:hypothetical protein
MLFSDKEAIQSFKKYYNKYNMKTYPETMYKTLQLKRKITKKIVDKLIYDTRLDLNIIDLSFYEIGDYIKIGKKYYQVIKAKI